MDNPSGSVDVPLSLYGGLNLELAPSDLPEGISPDCQDVVFLPGSVSSRPGLHSVFTIPFPVNTTVTQQKTYVEPKGTSLNLYMTNAGKLYKENVTSSPGTKTQFGSVVPPASGYFTATSVTAFGREYFAFSDGVNGKYMPMQYDGITFRRVTQDAPVSPGTPADAVAAGSVSAGIHGVVVMFQTASGYITAPSQYTNWTAAGGKKVTVTSLPIGPPNVIARIVAFTAAGGGNYFYIPTTPIVSGTAVGTSTVVSDNTSTTATFDFSDSTLLSSTAIDIPGNNLFANVKLPLCLGVFSYSQRLMYWGMDNVVQNLLNMGFDGGGTVGTNPPGWNIDIAGAVLSSTSIGSTGYNCAFTGNGGLGPRLTQECYEDENAVVIIKPSTAYTFKCFLSTNFQVTTGSFVCDIYSPSAGILASGSIALTTNMVGFYSCSLGTTPNAIPSDAILRIGLNGVPNAAIVYADELEVIYSDVPFVNNRAIMSYVQAPEQFDALTGQIGPADDPSPIICCSIVRDTMRIKTTNGMHNTQDNGTTEPSGWTVSSFSRTVGAVSIRGGDPGRFGSGDTAEDWDLTASYGGLYIDFGGDLYKISQEIQNIWDDINKAAIQTLWIKNDVVQRRVYIGIPSGANTTPSRLLVWDYRELDAALQIANAAPVHISFTGKMVSSDLTRKWTIWNLPMASGEILDRGNGVRQMCFGSGNGAIASNSYYLDPAKLTDDDFGQIYPYYTTYAFLNHEAEVALGTGVHRKLYRYLSLFASGTGTIAITQLADSLSNVWDTTPSYTLSTSPTYDLEWGLNVECERCFFRIASSPTSGTDNGFTLNKMVVSIQANPWSPVRGAI